MAHLPVRGYLESLAAEYRRRRRTKTFGHRVLLLTDQ